ncbi:MAG TPA: efflux RND transporter permease subunit [Gemmatimonadales bacterium]|nr:efflux RND transporter permease subunit [Gemmatimonadales bacterium]
MLTGLVRGSIRHRLVVITLAGALVVYGLSTLPNIPLDVFPEFAPPQVSIQTEAPGFSPEQVEVLVTKPIEDAINGVQGIGAVRSQSIQGLSVITAILSEHTDVYRARQSLAERLGEVVGRLPATVRPPVLTPLTSSSSTVLVFGITSPTRTLMDQRSFVDWVVRPRLLATPGVSKVAVFANHGLRQRSRRHDLSLSAHRDSFVRLIDHSGAPHARRFARRVEELSEADPIESHSGRIGLNLDLPHFPAEDGDLGDAGRREQPGTQYPVNEAPLVHEAASRRGDAEHQNGARGAREWGQHRWPNGCRKASDHFAESLGQRLASPIYVGMLGQDGSDDR